MDGWRIYMYVHVQWYVHIIIKHKYSLFRHIYSSVSSCTYPVGWSILHNSNNRDTCSGVIWGYFWDSLNNWTIL